MRIMDSKEPAKPRVFLDPHTLFAGAAPEKEHSATNLLLRRGELTLIEAITPTQVIIGAERNILLAVAIPRQVARSAVTR